MVKEIWFDMDGTIANLYGVENWLDYLLEGNPYPYMVAEPMVNMNSLARILNRLQRNGYKINIVSWLCKDSTEEYDRLVTIAKQRWIKKHLKSVQFTQIDILPYGTPKEAGRGGILFDDEVQNRENWTDVAYDVQNILEVLKTL